MKIDECTPEDVHTVGGGETPPSVGLASCALPEAQSNANTESSQTGVSIRNVLYRTALTSQRAEYIPHWYALRCIYGRVKSAYDYLVAKGITAFHPTTHAVKLINGKCKIVTESRLSNIFFAFGTEDQIKGFVYDNANLPHLRFYYRHEHIGRRIIKTPLIVPNDQLESLKIICAADASDFIVSLSSVPNFQAGQMVRGIEGTFKGVIGIVKRWQGQQRVGVIIGDMAAFATAYVPSAFLEEII